VPYPRERRCLEEPRRRYAGQAGVQARPRNVDHVAVLLRAANEAWAWVAPCDGGVGLVGGQVTPDGPAPLVLSLDETNALRRICPQENAQLAEAGAIPAMIWADC
jgi:FAD/FMN-containing dehydrogenase